MKICWDNLEGLRYNKKTGKWYKGNTTYTYKDECKICKESFLSTKESVYCCRGCSNKDKVYDNSGNNNPMYGKHHTDKSKKIMSDNRKNMCMGKNNPMYGKHHTEETLQKLKSVDHSKEKNGMYGKCHKKSTIDKLKKYKGEKSSKWSGGYWSKNLPLYDTYAPQIGWIESVRRNENDFNILEVKCTHCEKWFIPDRRILNNRIQTINGSNHFRGEHRLYCSEACKKACPLYGKSPEQLIKQDAVRAGRLPWIELEREMQPELRKMVLERDGYQCVKCGSTEKLCCHHILPVATNPLESADIDNCMTLCESCHKKVHSQPGCRYNEIKMEIC